MRLITLISFLDQWLGVLDTNADRIKLIVETIEIAEKVSKYLPIVVFSYAGLTLVFAVINILEHNITSGIILCVLASFGIYLALRIVLTRLKRHPRIQANT